MEHKGEVNKGREEAKKGSTGEHRRKSTGGEQQEEEENAEEGNCVEVALDRDSTYITWQCSGLVLLGMTEVPCCNPHRRNV